MAVFFKFPVSFKFFHNVGLTRKSPPQCTTNKMAIGRKVSPSSHQELTQDSLPHTFLSDGNEARGVTGWRVKFDQK